MQRPIGLFDSGFGGLTIMKAIVHALPHENLVYLGDTAHLPYGNKSPEKVIELSIENANFLLQKNIKLLVIACHTASSHAAQILRKMLPIPVIDVVELGLEMIRGYTKAAVLATTGTIESGIFQKRAAYTKACPLFVPLIEEGFHAHEAAFLIAKNYLGSFKGLIDAALLACTHYPLMIPIIKTILGPEVAILEPAQKCAEHIFETLSKINLLNSSSQKPSYEFFASDSPEKFGRLGEIFLGFPIQNVEKKQEIVKIFQ